MNPNKPLSEFTLREIRDCMSHTIKILRNMRNLQRELSKCSLETLVWLDEGARIAKEAHPEYKELPGSESFTNNFHSLLCKNIQEFESNFQDIKQELIRRDPMGAYKPYKESKDKQ